MSFKLMHTCSSKGAEPNIDLIKKADPFFANLLSFLTPWILNSLLMTLLYFYNHFIPFFLVVYDSSYMLYYFYTMKLFMSNVKCMIENICYILYEKRLLSKYGNKLGCFSVNHHCSAFELYLKRLVMFSFLTFKNWSNF